MDAFGIKKKKIIEKNVKQNQSKNCALGYTRYNYMKLVLFVIYLNTMFVVFGIGVYVTKGITT